MTKLRRRLFGEPDDVREVPFGRIETYDMGDMRVGRAILEPGWRWSESIKPIARTDLCEFHHLGLCVGGSARIRMREGAELVIEEGQFYEIPPGHDASVTSDVPWVTIDWYPSTAFARPEGGAFAASWRRCSAPTSSSQLLVLSPSATRRGATSWRGTTRSCVGSSTVSAVAR